MANEFGADPGSVAEWEFPGPGAIEKKTERELEWKHFCQSDHHAAEGRSNFISSRTSDSSIKADALHTPRAIEKSSL